MAIAKSSAAGSGGTTTSGTVSPATVNAGDYMVLSLEMDCHTSGIIQTGTITDTNSNSWSLLASIQSTVVGHEQRFELWGAKNPSAVTPTISVSISGAIVAWGASCCSFNGVDTTTPIADAALSNGTFTGVATDLSINLTTRVANECIVAVSGTNFSGDGAPPAINVAGYTNSGASISS